MAPLLQAQPRVSPLEGSVQTTFLMPLAVLVIFATAWVARHPVEARGRVANAYQRVNTSMAAVSIREGWRVYMRRTLSRFRPDRVPMPVIVAPTGNESTGPPLRLHADSPVELVSVSTDHLTSATGANFQPTRHERRASSLLRNRTPCSSPRVRAQDDTDTPQTVETPPTAAALLPSPAPPMTPVLALTPLTLRTQGAARSQSVARDPVYVAALDPVETARESGLPSFPRVPQHPLLSEATPSMRVNDTQPEPLAAPLSLLDA